MADKLRAHRALLLLLFAASTALRLSLAAARGFGAALALVLATEFFGSAVTLLVDAAVMAACREVRAARCVRCACCTALPKTLCAGWPA